MNNITQTKINAIEKSIEMWEYIQINKCIIKSEYFKAKGINQHILGGCYLCEALNGDCFKCINWNLEENTKYKVFCCYPNSPFYKHYRDNKPAYSIAPDMLKVLKRELKVLTGDVENE